MRRAVFQTLRVIHITRRDMLALAMEVLKAKGALFEGEDVNRVQSCLSRVL